MICKDCIHCDVCDRHTESDRGFPPYRSDSYANQCKDFKDKSKFLEFPCKVGDEIWFVYSPKFPADPKDKGKWFIVQDGIQRMIYGKKGFSIESWNIGTKSVKELGKTIFFTKAEAEARLKELEVEE